MAGFEFNKGLIALATEYSNGNYNYTKLDPYIATNEAHIAPDQIQDLDSYVNANGILKRTVLKHTRGKIDFSTCYMEQPKMKKFKQILRTAWSLNDGKCSKAERKVRVRIFNDLEEAYTYGFYYIDPSLTFNYGGTYKGYIMYLPVSVAMVEY